MRIPLARPEITEGDIEAVVQVLRTPDLSLGPRLPEFETAFSAYVGVPYAVALSSGTAGLHVALQALGIGEGHEVILPSFAFVAVANAVLHVGATPVFADIDPVSLDMTAATLARAITSRSRAIILVHTFGYPADLNPILAMARDRNLLVIEDACEAIGAEYHARKVGGFGDAGVFSFYPNKAMTTGEGGMVVTRDPGLARTMRALRNQGRMDHEGWFEHSLLGYNYRLSDINCALGIAQLKRIESILARRQAVARGYCQALRDCPGIIGPEIEIVDRRISWFVFVVRLVESGRRRRVIEHLTERGIGCRAYFPPIHLLPLYSGYRALDQALPMTEDVAARTLALPFFNQLTGAEIEEVCSVLRDAI
jgi:perosamine synthetase